MSAYEKFLATVHEFPQVTVTSEQKLGLFGSHGVELPDEFEASKSLAAIFTTVPYDVKFKGDVSAAELIVDIALGFVPGAGVVQKALKGDLEGTLKEAGLELLTLGLGKAAKGLHGAASALKDVATVEHSVEVYRVVRTTALVSGESIVLTEMEYTRVVEAVTISVQKNAAREKLVDAANKTEKAKELIESAKKGKEYADYAKGAAWLLRNRVGLGRLCFNIMLRLAGLPVPRLTATLDPRYGNVWETQYKELQGNGFLLTRPEEEDACSLYLDNALADKLFPQTPASGLLEKIQDRVKHSIEDKLNAIYANVERIHKMLGKGKASAVDSKVFDAYMDYMTGKYEYCVTLLIDHPKEEIPEKCEDISPKKLREPRLCF